MSKRRNNGTKVELKEEDVSPLTRLRNMEEFAALGQFLFMFGTGALGLADFNLEDIEYELFRPESTFARSIGLAMFKIISSQRGLVPEQFEEYGRKQYRNRKPSAASWAFGDEDEPKRFESHAVEDQVRILHQLSIWTFVRPERIRDKMIDCDEKEQLTWRMEPCGYDKQQNIYYILDDGRLYCRSRAEITTPTYATKRKSNKRRRVSVAATEADEGSDVSNSVGQWSCICVELSDWLSFADSLKTSRDKDEKALYLHLRDNVLPELHAEDEKRKKAALEKEKQRLIEEAVANRKRSSRLDAKLARQKEEEEKAELQRREYERLRNRKSEEKRLKDRQARVAARAERIKQRETHKDTTSGDDSSNSRARRSTRVKAKPKPVEEEEEDEWIFDCKCGVNGVNYQDGTEFIQCGSCDVWQHLDCQHLPSGYEGDYTCDICLKHEAQQASMAANPETSPRVTIKLRIGPPSPAKEKRILSCTSPLASKQQTDQAQSMATSPLPSKEQMGQSQPIAVFNGFEGRHCSPHPSQPMTNDHNNASIPFPTQSSVEVK